MSKEDQYLTLIIAYVLVVIITSTIWFSYEVHENSVCKQAAMSYNMPYLEIKELCK